MQLPLSSELKLARKQAGLTQVELAKLSGVSQSVIAKIENGKVDPAYSTVTKLFAAIEKIEKNVKTIKDVMCRRVAVAKPSDTVLETSKKMKKRGISQLPIVSNNKIIGLISENDLLTASEKHLPSNTPVCKIASPAPPIISSSAPASALQAILRHSPIVCVVEDNKLVGVVTKSDLLIVF